MKDLENNKHMIQVSLSEKVIIEVSLEGSLLIFDNTVCRNLADKEVKDKMEMAQVIAKLCVLLLDEAASIVDHIPHENSGTYGDVIRKLNKG